MERRKHRGSSNIDELAIVKAAAWAWYENGSGAEGRSVREYDLARTQRNPIPSRYKLEAMKLVHQELEDVNIRPNTVTESGEKSLFDTYEIERISRQLHSYIQSSRIEHLKSIFGGGGGHVHNNGNRTAAEYRKVVSLLSEESGKIDNKNSSNKQKKHNYKSLKGFWPVICGSGHDDVVVETREGGRRINFGRSSSRRRQQQRDEKNKVTSVETSGSHRRGAGVHAHQ